tara:strand:- start:19 stop:234 length:216 start_codon:yes stop_codon:yes gene_type:complete
MGFRQLIKENTQFRAPGHITCSLLQSDAGFGRIMHIQTHCPVKSFDDAQRLLQGLFQPDHAVNEKRIFAMG